MNDVIIVAVITGGMALFGTLISGVMSSRLMAYKIEELRADLVILSNRVDKNNKLVERMLVVERELENHSKRLERIERRYDGGHDDRHDDDLK